MSRITAGTGISVITICWSMASVSCHYSPDCHIYCTWLRGEPTPASPFTPFADVVEEYQHTAKAKPGSVMRHSGRTASSTAAARVTFSGTFSGAQRFGRDSAPETGIYRWEFRQLATQLSGVQRTDLALALAALLAGRSCNRMDYAAGFIFMRRLGSAALTASGPALNVLPLGIHIARKKRCRNWKPDWQHN
ncbi:hypothetical protein ACLK19_04005 [Escherichia coli]